jgi:hypothetical protein
MTTTITVRDLAEAWPSLEYIAEQKLKINPSFWLAHQMRKLATSHEIFVAHRLEVFKKYGVEPVPGSDTWTIKPENVAAANAELKALMDETLEVDVEPRPASYLGIDVEPVHLVRLHFLFTAPEEPKS